MNCILSFQHGRKAGSFQSFLQAAFNGEVLGESEKKPGDPEGHPVDYNFTFLLQLPNDARTRSDVAQKPVMSELCVSEKLKTVFKIHFDMSVPDDVYNTVKPLNQMCLLEIYDCI